MNTENTDKAEKKREKNRERMRELREFVREENREKLLGEYAERHGLDAKSLRSDICICKHCYEQKPHERGRCPHCGKGVTRKRSAEALDRARSHSAEYRRRPEVIERIRVQRKLQNDRAAARRDERHKHECSQCKTRALLVRFRGRDICEQCLVADEPGCECTLENHCSCSSMMSQAMIWAPGRSKDHRNTI